MITKDLLNEIIQDTSFNGKYVRFYEMLQDELDDYSDSKIEEMKDTLKFVIPNSSSEIDSYDRMKLLYEYSKLI